MSSRVEPLPKRLVVGVLLMTVVVLGLGGTIVTLKLRPARLPSSAIDRQVAEWQRVVLANPDDDSARVSLGLALIDAGKTDEAHDTFQEALDLNDENWMALFQLGLIAAPDDPAQALELFKRSISFAPEGNRAVVLIAEGDLLMEQEKPRLAKGAYEAAILDTPFIIDSHLGLAKALEALGDEKLALKEYKAAARFDPTNQEIADAIARLTDEK